MRIIRTIIKNLLQITKEEKVVPIEHRLYLGHELDGKVALITGGSGGIGFAIAQSLLNSGCKVIISGTNKSKLEETAAQLNSPNVNNIVLNYKNPKEFKQKINEAASIFGKIDIFISSAGIHVDRDGLDFLNVTEAEYDLIMQINLKGTYFICQTVAQYMINNKIKGHILIISSQSALEPSWSPYRLSKRGIEGITEGMAQRLLEHGIIVNAIGPGPTATSMQKNYDGKNIYTPLNPLQRYTMPQEIAEFAKLMVSGVGDTVVGDTLYMSGGRGIIEIR